MKICFYNVTATYIQGGLETYCWEAGRALARRGHEVTIVAGNDGDARHEDVRLVQFSFVHEKNWPDFGTRFAASWNGCPLRGIRSATWWPRATMPSS